MKRQRLMKALAQARAVPEHAKIAAKYKPGARELFPVLSEVRKLREAEGATVVEGELSYQVCDFLLDPETNEHCEFDGDVPLRWRPSVRGGSDYQVWDCPWCRHVRIARSESDV